MYPVQELSKKIYDVLQHWNDVLLKKNEEDFIVDEIIRIGGLCAFMEVRHVVFSNNSVFVYFKTNNYQFHLEISFYNTLEEIENKIKEKIIEEKQNLHKVIVSLDFMIYG